jgi:hypothetical protein
MPTLGTALLAACKDHGATWASWTEGCGGGGRGAMVAPGIGPISSDALLYWRRSHGW